MSQTGVAEVQVCLYFLMFCHSYTKMGCQKYKVWSSYFKTITITISGYISELHIEYYLKI